MKKKDWAQQHQKILLIEPSFPIPRKSKNHKDFLPIGLLKIASYLKSEGSDVKLSRLNSEFQSQIDQFDFDPDLILITSLFTYWAQYVREAVNFCRNSFPNTKIIVGGIYASLLPEDCKEFTGCDEVFQGVCEEAENFSPDYSLVDVDYQIIHASRGCIRKCACCGVNEIEPNFTYKKSIKNEIIKRKLVFYDNNLLANPYIENILEELVELKKKRIILNSESQSGFDGRILLKNPKLGQLLKKSNFINPKIAWDGPLSDREDIKKQIDILVDSGYQTKYISVFMLYNHDISFEDMEAKRIQCWEWNVQISDCRYRPLDRNFDNYNPYTKKPQSSKDYYIHPGWTDKLIRKFRSNIRKQNICVRQDILYYSADIERKRISKEEATKYKNMEYSEAKDFIMDAWNPNSVHIK
ncbi:Fe-S oxidoreductase [Methanobacterium sp. CWC-01]|uniref:cobalamin-dependent protein n=1 Tax=Methanobacterium aridiramus TaxID=2584467 RepID=UPI002575D580|nr:cobalamin-dependent protein [Methanobacterium sp. CWC-01]WJI10463.1 Fe-S oxidoreductase [Methanobacterium sp. CWC-01]